jgi:hypothetical protein
MFDKPVPSERTEMELPTASVPLDARIDKPELADHAMYDYHRAAQLAADSADSYARHLRDFGESVNLSTFSSHLDHMKMIRQLAEGDYNYLAAIRAKPADRKPFVEAARNAYRQAAVGAERVELKYFVDDGLLNLLHLKKTDILGMSDAQVRQAMTAVREAVARNLGGQINAEDRQEYEGYVQRAEARLAQLQKA